MTYDETIIAHLTAQQGLSAHQIAEKSGRPLKHLATAMWDGTAKGWLFKLPAKPHVRYFTTEAAMEAMRAQVDQDTVDYKEFMRLKHIAQGKEWCKKRDADPVQKALAAERQRRYAEKKKASQPPRIAEKRERKPRPLQLAKPKPIPLPDKLAAFKQQEAIIPANVKIQRIPTPPARFHVEPPRHGWASMGLGHYYPEAA